MNNITKGLIAGTLFGAISLIPMLFMTFEDKTKAMSASFISRFAIGFIIFNINLPVPNWLKGPLVGLVLSLPDAIVTNQFGPILGFGVIGGIICGLFVRQENKRIQYR
jgi:hypothetical protein